jgi:SAM-dependent methyltransferase
VERFSGAADPRAGFFDGLAERWDVLGQSPDETLRAVERQTERLGLRPGECLLEVGCGSGQLTGWLAERVRPGRVVAVDFAPEMLRMAEAKGIAATFRLADACQDDLGREEFDVALCFHSFPHFRDQPAALRNLARALKPLGRLIVMHLCGREEVNAFHRNEGGVIAGDFLPDDRQWREWLSAAGFAPPEIEDGDGGFFLRAVLQTPQRLPSLGIEAVQRVAAPSADGSSRLSKPAMR